MSINWNKIAVAAAVAGMSYFGVPVAQAESSTDCTTGGANAARTQTNGSTALHTSPATIAEQRQYGPQVSPDMVWLVAD
jgi:hypothetical protein